MSGICHGLTSGLRFWRVRSSWSRICPVVAWIRRRWTFPGRPRWNRGCFHARTALKYCTWSFPNQCRCNLHLPTCLFCKREDTVCNCWKNCALSFFRLEFHQPIHTSQFNLWYFDVKFNLYLSLLSNVLLILLIHCLKWNLSLENLLNLYFLEF